MPKNGSEFLGKVDELRRTFQKHIRDDRKELLPAILQVLSAEEAQAVADKVEDEVASFDEAREPELDGQAHDLRTVPEGVVEIMHAGTESAQAVTFGVHDISRECLRHCRMAPADQHRWLDQTLAVPIPAGSRNRADLAPPG